MRRLVAAAVLPLALWHAAAWAQAPGGTSDDGKAGRPSSEAVDAVAPPEKPDPARFGKLPDEAFGAFQRGHYLTALDLARPRAEAGDAAAQTLIAEIYARGLGVRRDIEEAARWYARAAEQGDPEAQLQYALMLIDGRLVEEDRDKAFELMRKAAEAGKPLAQFNLAQMLVETGAGEEEAAVWYERSAEAGLPDAQYAMAQIHATGFGGRARDDTKARRWLERAARQNFDTAQLDLGTWLVEGKGGEADPEAGFGWLKRAAEGGNAAAQNRLAKLYRSGIGTEGDPVLAAAWYITARRAGLRDPEMEDFMQGLTEGETKQALEQANTIR